MSGWKRVWSSRSTTSCSSRARPRRWTARSSWCGARCAPRTSSIRRSRSMSASARTGSTPSSSAGPLDLLEGGGAVRDLELGLLDGGPGDQIRGGATRRAAIVLSAVAGAGVVRARSGVAAVIVAGLDLALAVAVVPGLVLARRRGGLRTLALDLGRVDHQPADCAAREEVYRHM